MIARWSGSQPARHRCDLLVGLFLSGILMAAQGNLPDAIHAFDEAARCSGGSPYAIGFLACVRPRGDAATARNASCRDCSGDAKTRYVPPEPRVCVWVREGARSRVQWLERALEEQEHWLFSTRSTIRPSPGCAPRPRMADLCDGSRCQSRVIQTIGGAPRVRVRLDSALVAPLTLANTRYSPLDQINKPTTSTSWRWRGASRPMRWARVRNSITKRRR